MMKPVQCDFTTPPSTATASTCFLFRSIPDTNSEQLHLDSLSLNTSCVNHVATRPTQNGIGFHAPTSHSTWEPFSGFLLFFTKRFFTALECLFMLYASYYSIIQALKHYMNYVNCIFIGSEKK